MTVRTNGPLTFGPGDFVRKDRGITWGIKVTDYTDEPFVIVYVQAPDGNWLTDTLLESQVEPALRQSVERDYGGDTVKWFKQRFIPALNVWLAKRFPPTTAIKEPDSIPVQADRLIQQLRIVEHPDGTLKAEA